MLIASRAPILPCLPYVQPRILSGNDSKPYTYPAIHVMLSLQSKNKPSIPNTSNTRFTLMQMNLLHLFDCNQLHAPMSSNRSEFDVPMVLCCVVSSLSPFPFTQDLFRAGGENRAFYCATGGDNLHPLNSKSCGQTKYSTVVPPGTMYHITCRPYFLLLLCY